MDRTPEILRATLESRFREIEETRMDGVPILNKNLCVAALGFEPWQDYALGVLITPWFMNLVLIPLDQSKFTESGPQVGDKRTLGLPAGQVEFILGYEEGYDWSLSCSLFSPVFEFESQSAALETAKAALTEALNEAVELDAPEQDMLDIWDGKLPEPESIEEIQEKLPASSAKDMDRRTFLRGTTASSPPKAAEEVS